MRKKKAEKKIIVAMSGGIDSSVAAALLKKKGFKVIGIFIRLWTPVKKNGTSFTHNSCYTPESERRARRVAEILGIPFYVFNFEKEFKRKVVDYFLRAQKIGLTPNPCVVCNKEIKFGLLLKKLKILKFDYIATGHYARVKQLRRGLVCLLKGKDKEKDQSYFLWQMSQKILKKTIFPVGDYTKLETRRLAKKFKLPVLNVPESQEICFIRTPMFDFLKKHLGTNPGKIVDSKGKTIGEHRSLWAYTIGQRRGIEVSGGPFYVLGKDVKRNLLIVTQNEKDLYKKELIAKNLNWISGKTPKLPLRVKAKIRHRHKPAFAKISWLGNGKIKVVFSRPQKAITPGQSAVFYRKEELLGGGIIDK